MKLSYKTLSLLLILFVCTLLNTTRGFALEQTYLVFDATNNEAPIAKKFRILPDLQASASGQFSADELPKILRAIPAERRQDIWIVDLRQESHGFIDGMPVSWVTDRNAANQNKSSTQIEREEKKLLKTAGKRRTIIVHALKKLANGKVATETPTTMLPEAIETEEELVTSLNAQYARIYVLDHNKPSDAEVDNFVLLIKHKVKDNEWLHFHCRGGSGRASTFMTMYDIIRNAKNTPFEIIIQRQVEQGNKKLDQIPDADNAWKSEMSHERFEFVRKFYAYVSDPQGYKVRSWSSWQNLQQNK